ncbi:hypothetical protein PCL_01909 [Purpureocillium lilacinum]|uniref:Uncharacterized protein n=1 Tax=Purpureocillium lilacinum TaxID=33203 RepID=A0A2U3E2U4_PURLI|nr:hypothetical protein Purlil1_28 [Purpureocillium lilacinum]PWI68820.1 hypothetical protein PCL_01909 [Purpureocillium lilacinum]
MRVQACNRVADRAHNLGERVWTIQRKQFLKPSPIATVSISAAASPIAASPIPSSPIAPAVSLISSRSNTAITTPSSPMKAAGASKAAMMATMVASAVTGGAYSPAVIV